MPGIAAGAGFAAGFAAGFVAAFGAGLAAGLAVVLAALARAGAPLPGGALVIPGMSICISIEDIPGICAIMRCSTGSVMTRSRITGSAIMRRWIAIRLESLLFVPDIVMPDMRVPELVAPLAAFERLEPDMFMPE